MQSSKFKAFLSILFVGLCTVASSQTTNNLHVKESVTFDDIFQSSVPANVSCYRIPAIVTAPNGDLVVAADERVPSCGDLKWNDNINIVIRRSEDNGKNWSEIETIVDYPVGKSASDPSMIVDRESNTIFLFYNFMDLVNEKDIYYLKVIKSLDNGKTWSAPIDITSQITKPEWHKDFKFITSGRGIQTSTGKLIHTLVNLNRGLFLFASDDLGNSWYLIDVPIKNGDESKVVELTNGKWMINSRVNGAGCRFVHTSADQGRSWESVADSELIDPGCNACILNYKLKDRSGKNVLVFANVKTKDKRENLTISLSYDEGQTWTAGKTIYSGSAAYSSMTILSDGSIGLIFEKDEYQKISFVQFPFEYLISTAE